MPTINGTSGNDTLTGTAIGDTINGLDGNDILTGGDGADTINGGNGTDMVDYSAETGIDAVIVNLSGASVTVGGVTVAASQARDTFGATDTLSSIENVTTGTGNDTIYGGTGVNILIGGDGNDTIYGGGGADNLYGGSGDDILNAGASAYGSWLEGGSGDDTYYVTASSVDVSLIYDEINEIAGGGYDTVHIQDGYMQAGLLGQVERIILDGSANSGFQVTDAVNRDVTGSSGNNLIRTAGGVDTINAGDGDDAISAGAGGDTINGGNGSDTLLYENTSTAVTIDLLAGTASGGDAQGDTFSSIENVTGGSGNDTLSGTNGDNVIEGGAGADTMTGRQGNDTYVVDNAGDVVTEASGEGTDTIRTKLASYTLGANLENLAAVQAGSQGYVLTGNSVANVITGAFGNDTLNGLAGNDTLNGGEGIDTLNGGANNDTLNGGNGNDMLDGGSGDDTMTGGTGNDTYVIDSESDVVVEGSGGGTDTLLVDVYDYTMSANVEDLLYIGLDYIYVTGNGSDNTITTGDFEDVITGEGGNDTIYALLGDDIIDGGDGNDVLVGAGGADWMTGGSGADTFVFADDDLDTVTGIDYIADFAQGTDKIDLSAMDAVTGGGDNAFSFIGTGAFTNVAGQLRYSTSGGTTTIQADVDGDGAADFTIQLAGTIGLTSGDFIL